MSSNLIFRNLLKLNGTSIGLPKGLITPDEWKEMVKVSSTTIFIPIKSIIESSENIISDINHLIRVIKNQIITTAQTL